MIELCLCNGLDFNFIGNIILIKQDFLSTLCTHPDTLKLINSSFSSFWWDVVRTMTQNEKDILMLSVQSDTGDILTICI